MGIGSAESPGIYLNTSKMKQFLVAVVLAALFVSGEAINCYDGCSGLTNEASTSGCTLTTDDSCTYCQKYKVGIASTYSYSRSCVSTCTAGGGFIWGTGAETYCCQTEACNSASVAKVSVPLVLLTVAKMLF